MSSNKVVNRRNTITIGDDSSFLSGTSQNMIFFMLNSTKLGIKTLLNVKISGSSKVNKVVI